MTRGLRGVFFAPSSSIRRWDTAHSLRKKNRTTILALFQPYGVSCVVIAPLHPSVFLPFFFFFFLALAFVFVFRSCSDARSFLGRTALRLAKAHVFDVPAVTQTFYTVCYFRDVVW